MSGHPDSEPRAAGPRNEERLQLPPEWLVEFDQRAEATALSRLEADQDVLLILQLDGYEGDSWLYFSDVLARYGFAVIQAWLIRGLIVERCIEKGIRRGLPKGRDAGALHRDDAATLAGETVAEAIHSFRERVLKTGRWDPSRGPGRTASLKSFFVGHCLLRFPDIYHRQRTERDGWYRRQDPTEDLDPPSGTDDPEQITLRRLELQETEDELDARTLQVFRLRAEGYTHAEIVELLADGTTARAIDALVYRHRQRQHGRGET